MIGTGAGFATLTHAGGNGVEGGLYRPHRCLENVLKSAAPNCYVHVWVEDEDFTAMWYEMEQKEKTGFPGRAPVGKEHSICSMREEPYA
jgi:hypothetical protein